jgi:hypothetical protein
MLNIPEGNKVRGAYYLTEKSDDRFKEARSFTALAAYKKHTIAEELP